MSIIGQIERATQKRVVKLFTQTLGYDYLGNWHERPNNRNIEESFLRAWLAGQYDDALITRAIAELQRAAGDSSRIPYDVNRSVYELLRYGMKVSAGAGENYHTIRLIDWANPEANHFAIAEEVTVSGADTQSSTKRPDIVLYVNGIEIGRAHV